jgi:hypothetical protein
MLNKPWFLCSPGTWCVSQTQNSRRREVKNKDARTGTRVSGHSIGTKLQMDIVLQLYKAMIARYNSVSDACGHTDIVLHLKI